MQLLITTPCSEDVLQTGAFKKPSEACVLPSDPMSKWLFVLLLTLSQAAQASPDSNSGDSDYAISNENKLLVKLDSVRHGVVDRTSDLVVTAMGFLGVPYRRGGNSADTGFDCSGLVRTIYGQTIGLMLPRRADEQAAATQTIDKKELRPGDLVFFNTMRRAPAPKCVSKTCRPAIGSAALMAHAASAWTPQRSRRSTPKSSLARRRKSPRSGGPPLFQSLSSHRGLNAFSMVRLGSPTSFWDANQGLSPYTSRVPCHFFSAVLLQRRS